MSSRPEGTTAALLTAEGPARHTRSGWGQRTGRLYPRTDRYGQPCPQLGLNRTTAESSGEASLRRGAPPARAGLGRTARHADRPYDPGVDWRCATCGEALAAGVRLLITPCPRACQRCGSTVFETRRPQLPVLPSPSPVLLCAPAEASVGPVVTGPVPHLGWAAGASSHPPTYTVLG